MSNKVRLSTKRLELTAATPDHLHAEIQSPEHLASLLKVQVEPGWPPGEYDREAQEFFLSRLKEGGIAVTGWYTWYAVRCGDAYQQRLLVGAGGYSGPPNQAGEVEIGFSIMPAQQGLGYATELAEALVQHAFADIRVKKVAAHAAPLNLASSRVLEKCGFRFVCEDGESGSRRFEILRTLSADSPLLRL